MSSNTVTKILILAANPKSTEPLRLDEEVRAIQAGLERSRRRDQFEIITRSAVRYEDLRRALLDYEPQIVHFAGHGAGSQGLALMHDSGEPEFVRAQSLAKLFKLFKEVECVLLNACYSEVQANAICQHIDYVIGMKEIADSGAIKFAVGFYDALGAGRSIEDAYEFGCSAIDLDNVPEHLIPVLKKNTDVSLVLPESATVEEPKPASTRPQNDTIRSASTLPSIPSPIPETQPTAETLPVQAIEEAKKAIALQEPEGQVPLVSALYVERPPIESDCYETIVKPGALIRIKAPRQMGKSSLMSRILDRASQQGYRTACVNFQSADAEFLTNLDLFLQWFCASIAEELELEDKLDKHWKGVLGSKNKCTKYFQRYLLSEINTGLALGLDGVDLIFKYPEVATDFFGLLRAWHEKGRNEPVWQKLRLAIAHSKEVYIPLNINQSPFNVGLPIELPEFNRLQVQDLVRRHGLNWSEAEVDRLMTMVGGHPYLVRVALYQIARERMTLETLLQMAPTEEGPYYNHLHRHLLNLEQDAELAAAIAQVVKAREPIEIRAAEAFKLRSMGLVKFQGNAVTPLGEVYRQYFQARLASNPTQEAIQTGNLPPRSPVIGIPDPNTIVLAAIVFTDVVNSTVLMASNQGLMLELLDRDFGLMREMCQRFDGRILKGIGDGMLIYFDSAVQAVAFAKEIQETFAKASARLPRNRVLLHRIGVHLGDVVFRDEDVFGTAVNLAARLQGKARPGGICISQTVYDVVKHHLSLNEECIGPQDLKGIPEPVTLYLLDPVNG